VEETACATAMKWCTDSTNARRCRPGSRSQATNAPESKRCRCFETQRRRAFPLQDYDLSTPGEVPVGIAGRILDDRYTRLLLQQPQLSLAQVMLLDRVQKGRIVSREEHKLLKAANLVEGRYPHLLICKAVARATGDGARHIRQRGFDKNYYLDLILELVRVHGPVSRKVLNDLLVSKIPERMTAQQKRDKVRNLVQELRRDGQILNRGNRGDTQWVMNGGASVKS
jgi:ATP-dependent DNA helicase RecG